MYARIGSFMYLKESFHFCIIHDFGWYMKRHKGFVNFILKNYFVRHYNDAWPTTALIGGPLLI